MRKLKEIALRFKAKGEGIVNYDHLTDQNRAIFHISYNTKNVKLSKRVWEYNEETDKLDYKIAISSDLIRTTIFNNHLKSPTMTYHPLIMCDHYSNINSLLRGWMEPVTRSMGHKRKSPITVSKLIQTCKSKSFLEIGTKRGEIQDSNETNNLDIDAKKSKSLRNTETIGKIKYSGCGFIDIQQIQFLSLDDMFDRLAMNSDYVDTFTEMFNNKYGFDLEPKHYIMLTETVKYPENGILFNDDILNLMIRTFLKNLYNFNVKKNTSYVYMTDLEYKPIYRDDSFNDSVSDEKGWIKINKESEINDINFEYETYFMEADLNSVNIMNQAIEYRKIKEAEEKKLKEEKKEADKVKRNQKKEAK